MALTATQQRLVGEYLLAQSDDVVSLESLLAAALDFIGLAGVQQRDAIKAFAATQKTAAEARKARLTAEAANQDTEIAFYDQEST